jgi:hypothetical protein
MRRIGNFIDQVLFGTKSCFYYAVGRLTLAST